MTLEYGPSGCHVAATDLAAILMIQVRPNRAPPRIPFTRLLPHATTWASFNWAALCCGIVAGIGWRFEIVSYNCCQTSSTASSSSTRLRITRTRGPSGRQTAGSDGPNRHTVSSPIIPAR